MAGTWKTARVFISSTFRDMHAERDHLIKVTFPRLRQWCAERRLHLVDIDLRWGVTKDEADNGKAIEICLKEIDGSRPFFVCILGERYGWVPDKLPPEEIYRFHGVQKQTGMSITHLEIHHAIESPVPRKDGKDEQPCPHAFFYFRERTCVPEPAALKGLSDAERKEHQEAFFEQERPALLSALKDSLRVRLTPEGRIHDYSGAWDAGAENPEDDKLKGRLTDLDAFGDRVEADLIRGISAQFKDHIAAAAQKADPLDEELALHEGFIENRTQVHIPRQDIEKQLTAYADGTDALPLVLSGPPGSGKSAILAHWVRERRGPEESPRKDEFLVARFIGASPASIGLPGLLGSVCAELLRRFSLTEEVEEEVPGSSPSERGGEQKEKRKVVRPMVVPADPIEVQNKWPRFLEAAGRKGRVVIVLDAVNQLERGVNPRWAYWIPHRLPAGIRLVLSAIDNGEASKAPAPGAPIVPLSPTASPADWLSELRRREIREVPVTALSDGDRRGIIEQLPSAFCKTLSDDQKDRLLKNKATANPLFLTVALEELRVFGSFEKLPAAIDGLPQLKAPEIAGNIEAALNEIFVRVLDRLDRESRRQAPGVTPKLFALLACARDGLSEQELDGLLARALPKLKETDRRGAMQVALRQVRSYLQRKQAQGTVLLDFYHRSFWKAVVGKYLPADEAKAAAHVEIADYFETLDWFAESLEEQRARAKRLPPTPRPVIIRKVVELPWQRLEAAKLVGKDDAQSPYWDKVADLLTHWEFLEAKAEADG